MALVIMPSTAFIDLLALPEPVYPFFEKLLDQCFEARFFTMKTIGQLRVQMSSYSVPSLCFPNASPPIIQSRICRVSSYRSRFKFGLEQHMASFHPAKWENLNHRLYHNRMPWPMISVVVDPSPSRIHPAW